MAGRPVTAVVTGMGTERAAAACQRLLDAVPVERAVMVGITGALDPTTPVGTVVRPEAVVDGATGAEYTPHPWPPGGPAPRGRMWTADGLVTDAGLLARLRDQGVVCLDMETATVARVCEERGVPWSVVRVVSDRAGDGTVDDAVLGLSRPDGTPDLRAVARYLGARPARIPVLLRLALGSGRATRLAAREAVAACLPAAPGRWP